MSDDPSKPGSTEKCDPDDDEDPPVGYCSPPREYQWVPGDSPNPNGRPRKKIVEMKLPKGPNPLQRHLLDYANEFVGEVNGRKITGYERAHMTLRAHMEKSPEATKKLLDMYNEASNAEFEFRMLVATEAMQHKEKWQATFDTARRLGRKLPNVYPDPDDTIIGPDLTVTFLGPITAEEAQKWALLIEGREKFFTAARMMMKGADRADVSDKRYQAYMKIRRQFYRLNRRIPDKFKKKYPEQFPPFEPQPADSPPDSDKEEE